MRTLLALLCVPALLIGGERDEKAAVDPNAPNPFATTSRPMPTRLGDPIPDLKVKIARLEKRANRKPEDWIVWREYAIVHMKYNMPNPTLAKVEGEAKRIMAEDIEAAKADLIVARAELEKLELKDLELRKVEAAEAQADAIFEQNAILRAEAERRGTFIPR